ncbi:MAG: hypothetical protein R3228_00510 [Halioglobus sp.]|nr:hypothetical protein [Halioglobus sp.]
MLNKILTVLAGLVSLMLLAIGARFLADPAGAAAELGMPLLDGLGRSTQIGDLTAFFVTAGAFGLAGLIRRNAILLYTPAALVGLAAGFRTLAWLLQDAALAPQIGPEIVMFIIYIAAARSMARSG